MNTMNLESVKSALGITGTYQDATLQVDKKNGGKNNAYHER